jgi:hypothetical protein
LLCALANIGSIGGCIGSSNGLIPPRLFLKFRVSGYPSAMNAPMRGAAGEWAVVVARPYDRGDPADGAEERPVAQGAEDEARRVYAEEVAVAAERGYQYVTLRQAGRDVDRWPPATGWTC